MPMAVELEGGRAGGFGELEGELGGVEGFLGGVAGFKLSKFDEDGASASCKRCVLRARGVSDVGSGRVVAVFVGEGPFQHQKLFSEVVGVRREGASRLIANDGGGACDLLANSVQHAPVYAGEGGGNPGEGVEREDFLFLEIGA